MKIKQMTDEIKKDMPDELNELETLRYIYIYLGKQKSFDPEYYFGDKETKKKVYRLANEKLKDEEFLASNKNLICTSLASSLELLGIKFGINIERVENEHNGHMYNIVNLKDGRRVHLDIQQDLRFIHSGLETGNFGNRCDLCTVLDKEEIERIDKKIGYPKQGKSYNNSLIIDIVKKLSENTELDRVKGLLNNEEFNKILKEEGISESVWFVDYCLNAINARNSSVITCYRDEDINKQKLPERQYSMCVFSRVPGEEKKFNIYMFKQKEKKFVIVSLEEMKKLVQQGLKLKQNEDNLYDFKRLKELLNYEDNEREEHN